MRFLKYDGIYRSDVLTACKPELGPASRSVPGQAIDAPKQHARHRPR
jgi:hypothetical protein